MKLKQRLKLHMFWIGIVSLIFMLVDNVASSYFNVNISGTLNKMEQTICIVLSILVFLGVLSNKPDRLYEEQKEMERMEKENKDILGGEI